MLALTPVAWLVPEMSLCSRYREGKAKINVWLNFFDSAGSFPRQYYLELICNAMNYVKN